MSIRGSYHNGFAPRDAEPLYPQLWRGCVGAWAPLLGPSGTTLRDWSGFGKHGALNNMDPATDWIVSDGKYGLDFDGTDDYVSTPFNFTSNAITLSIWERYTSNPATTFPYMMEVSSRSTINGGTGYVVAGLGGNSGATSVRFVANQAAATAICDISFTKPTTAWNHWAATWDGATAILYFNGAQVASTTSANTLGQDAVMLYIGALSGGTVRYWRGILDCAMVHARALPESEIRLLASRRGIAYETQRSRRGFVAAGGGFNASFARGSNVILSPGSY